MTKNKRLMFVYGTLKKGERLHGLLSKQKRIGSAITTDSNFTIKDFLNSYPITFRHFDTKLCKYKIKGELYEIKSDVVYESVVAMELNAGYELVNTIVETEDGKEHIAEMFLVEETPAKVGGNTILTNKRIVTTDNVKEWTTKV
jgi:gamma-glutamylcyclotransferase (GGCT)/AIG2-like uncharacterized protein YtfP|tara:strand:- start:1573 stop:2004 length:432 start_codon:yes stop_codon:yes gene_type:complete